MAFCVPSSTPFVPLSGGMPEPASQNPGASSRHCRSSTPARRLMPPSALRASNFVRGREIARISVRMVVLWGSRTDFGRFFRRSVEIDWSLKQGQKKQSREFLLYLQKIGYFNMKKLFSRQSILPDRTNHYDENGHKVGYSRTTLLGYTNHYDEHGHKVGYSRDGLFGTVHYDEKGHRVGVSHDSILGYKNHYDNQGHKVGYTRDTLLGKKTKVK